MIHATENIDISTDVVISRELSSSVSGDFYMQPDEHGNACLLVGFKPSSCSHGRSAGIELYGNRFAYIYQQLDPAHVSSNSSLPRAWSQTDFVTNVDRKFVMQDGSIREFSTEYPPADGTVVLDTTLSNCASQELANALWPFLSSKVLELIQRS